MTHQVKKRGSTSVAFDDPTNIIFHGVGTLLIEDKDDSIKEFCQAEYKKDWYAAYRFFIEENTTVFSLVSS